MPLTNLCPKDVAQEAQAASTEMLELRQDGGLNMDVRTQSANPASAGFSFCVRQAWRVARKRNQLGCGGHAGDLEVKVLYTPGKGKC